MIIEVSKKQDYIFSKKKLKENVERSNIINYVTSNEFFTKEASKYYSTKENFIYSGGGHTVLQFNDKNTAINFAKTITEFTMMNFDGLELFVKQINYDNTKSPSENFLTLSQELEKKKSLRKTGFKRFDFGFEKIDEEIKNNNINFNKTISAPYNYTFTNDFSDFADNENFIAVVHIDGNAMGKRVESIYGASSDFNTCCEKIKRFSECIQSDFETAFNSTVLKIIDTYKIENNILPIRPVILAGDDVCFVSSGNIGLECARIFLENLSNLVNSEDKLPYSACAGVAIVKLKYPFHKAYDLSEELCSNAKKYGFYLDENSRVSAMDWHIEFNQIKDNLSAIREDYITDDGAYLNLRPMSVVIPDKSVDKNSICLERTYEFFNKLCKAMQGEYGKVARSKIKQMRQALKQGEEESKYYIKYNNIEDILYNFFDSKYFEKDLRYKKYYIKLKNKEGIEKETFVNIDDEKRCVFFDAIEMIDHYTVLEEVDL